MTRRVVVTGVGAVTSIGETAEAFWGFWPGSWFDGWGGFNFHFGTGWNGWGNGWGGYYPWYGGYSPWYGGYGPWYGGYGYPYYGGYPYWGNPYALPVPAAPAKPTTKAEK